MQQTKGYGFTNTFEPAMSKNVNFNRFSVHELNKQKTSPALQADQLPKVKNFGAATK